MTPKQKRLKKHAIEVALKELKNATAKYNPRSVFAERRLQKAKENYNRAIGASY